MYAFLAAALFAAQSVAIPPETPVQATPSASVGVAPTPCCTLVKLTPVALTIGEQLDSDKSRIGQSFSFRLAEPITVADGLTIPAGTPGVGEVVHAAKSRAMGKAGELVLAARYLDWNGTRIPLRSFRFGKQHGKDNATTAAVVGVVVSAWLTPFITGGEVRIPAGTDASAKVAAETSVTPPAVPVAPAFPAPDPAVADNNSQGGEK
jgi:hypothetical protein